ncbi:MAG TPA: DMT family transporter [Ferrovibrio sp.]|uniref:DMT family transporter n=1 Tax=Ferrovibrio sp. TaxID=1917215 RepID=UPI002B4B7FE2|nr:DMT family transporter [Ferrovibrio sp.]HLT76421.1 DMT family transporter [Ferrovibrio sp.]
MVEGSLPRMSSETAAAEHWRGIAFMLLGTALFTFNDALGKWMVASVAVGQLLFIRSVAAFVMLAPAIQRAGWREVFVLAQPGRHALRLVLIVAEVACFYLAVRHLPLADVMAVYQATPIFVAVLAIPLLGERIGWRRGIAVAVGFIGVLLVLQPEAGVFTAAALIALAGSTAYALTMIATRHLRAASALSLIVYHTLAVGAAGLISLPWGWAAIGWVETGYLALIGVVATLAHMCMNQALRLAPATVVVPYTYTSLLWAILLGWLFFADTPTPLMLLGAAIIVGSGLFVMHREQRRRTQD